LGGTSALQAGQIPAMGAFAGALESALNFPPDWPKLLLMGFCPFLCGIGVPP
jgi:hypothetical protein